MSESKLRQALADTCRELERLNLNQGTAGNLSVRVNDAVLITPSGIPYDRLKPEMIARMPLGQNDGAWTGPHKPSSEWRMHLDILRARPQDGAVIHTHSVYATALSMLREEIPAAHYMIAAFGGSNVRCTAYAPYGTQELSDLAVEGLHERHGVLLGQHGMIVTGRDLGQAMWRAVELETLAKMYVIARAIGRPHILPDEEIAITVERFKSYGYQSDTVATLGPASPAKRPRKAAAARPKKA
ncbi:class II aldolase [Methylovirgula ligni]|uniref:L-fuculose-phosphate aldolase n=1 Tax=Methylovirgula ligni TaxID=569860 RepID=A0A3D9YZQ2_9HYPH|nr:class II aldolase/adducin family protein [Methylovirgula ligni]QAY96835.1 class II aldolase [Methylovirgula ligni]REF88127.1 L-fuculose-phosphate aldolase [Methylovirgula ligni]